MRKLATIRKIAEIKTIDGADRIVAYRVDGWWVVDTIGKYEIGDVVVYLEIDSWVPHELAPFLTKDAQFPKEYNGIKGQRLRTVKLRGTISQGLLLPLREVETFMNRSRFVPIDNLNTNMPGTDLSDDLGIQKWEAPIPANLAGQVQGQFPTNLMSKTDQERCVSGDTLISTEYGNKTICQIVDEEYSGLVTSFNHITNKIEMKPVIGWSSMTNKRSEWVKIITKTGKEMIVTRNHRIYLTDLGCYREASEMQIGDIVNIL